MELLGNGRGLWLRATTLLTRVQWVPLLLLRLFLGYFFVESGWGKVHNLATFAERFAEWGIPLPHFNAVLSAYTELVGGALLLLGLGARLVALPLAINMAVATISVKLAKVATLNDFVELDEPLYGLVFLLFVFTGAGKASLDALLERFWPESAPPRGK